MKILIVDDSGFSLNVCKDAFQKHGHDVDVAVNGSDCLDMYNFEMIRHSTSSNKTPYDVVILDYNMPGQKGDEIARKILEINYMQKIMIMSSWDAGKIQNKFSALADHVELIEKGTPLEEIISSLEMRQIS